jgi:hypothetical protein
MSARDPKITTRVALDSLLPPMRRAYERHLRAEPADAHRVHSSGAHLYGRVSTEEQAGPGKTSIDEQIRLCESSLTDTGIPIVGR